MAHQDFEILAPGGDLDSILAAIAAGADAVYCGLDRFNARNRATNISLDELNALLPIAHQHGCKIFLTLNIIFLEAEFAALVRLLNQLSQTSLDGVIVQDLGLAYLIKQHFPHLSLHASTQMNSLNIGQVDALSKLGFDRINLARELSAQEIKPLASYARDKGMDIEIFVHGSYCISFSGLCYASSVRNGASGNRGRCSQPCRDVYQKTDMGISHALNMKDNSAFMFTDTLKESGSYSFKIEGRIKGAHYVYHAVKTWRKKLEAENSTSDMTPLYQVFNRDFSAGYLQKNISQQMYIDNPRDYSADYLTKKQGLSIDGAKKQVYDQKTLIIEEVKKKTAPLIKLMQTGTRDSEAQSRRYWELPKRSGRGVSSELKRDKPRGCVLVDSESLLEGDAIQAKLVKKNAPLASILEQIDANHLDIYYQMPAHFKGVFTDIVTLFTKNSFLIPLFPAVLIGDDYAKACELLHQLKPKRIVSNNLGLGYFAFQQGIEWIAGPELNISNSYAMDCLQQEFGASGAFVSDELKRMQMLRIAAPQGFELHYNLYHPIRLMTSRQCFSLTTTGCNRGRRKVTPACLADCEMCSQIENSNGETYLIDKRKGQYNQLIYNKACLNDEILLDLSQFFSHVMLDFTGASERLELTTNQQYKKGV